METRTRPPVGRGGSRYSRGQRQAADYKVRLGSGRSNLRFPYILGRDFSGVVSAVGPGVTDLAVGDAVFGVCDQGIEGAYRKDRHQGCDHCQEARPPRPCRGSRYGADQPHRAVGPRGYGAAQGRRNHFDPGRRGGVAGFGIQLAKYIGATVITTASARNHDYVRSLGADRVIDYNVEDFTKTVANCDMVFDTVGGEVQLRSYAVLKPGGRLVWVAAAPEGSQPPRSDVQTLRPGVARDRKHLERMSELLESGAVWPPEIIRYNLTDAAEAHRVSESRHLRGKLVFEVR